jgi:hypothetical protein
MPTQSLEVSDVDLRTAVRQLLLVWQNPDSRRFVKVGRLDQLVDGRFAFGYMAEARDEPGFFPLDEYPAWDRVYVSDELPVFFSNRVMSSERPSYDEYLSWLGVQDLSDVEVPIEILVRTGGGRATDTFHVVDHPFSEADGFESRFFVSGSRHIDGADERIAGLMPQDALDLRLDALNQVNSKAVVVDHDGKPIGWVPDWLCADVADLMARGWDVSAVAERVNPAAPAHVRVLCRIEARPRVSA